MPYKFEKLKFAVGKEKDRRRKLSDEDREEIKHKYGTISQRDLARMYGVSRRLIIFIGKPEVYEHNKELRKINGLLNNNYYNREKHNKAMRIHRKHKYKLFKENETKTTQ